MAFVSEDCIKQWFQTDSVIYKNFAYLFKNKLWSKKTPGGFSLCPYFWLSMFSLLIFKPIIEPSILILKWVGKALLYVGGTPFIWWDKTAMKKIGVKNGHPGFGILLSLLLMIFTVAVLAGACLFYKFNVCLFRENVKLFTVMWWMLINMISAICIVTYIKNHKYKSNRCKVEWYMLVIFIGTTTIMTLIFPTMVMHRLHNLKDIICFVACDIVPVLKIVGHNLMLSLGFVGHYLWIAIKFTGLFLGDVFVTLIPFMLILAGLGFLGFLSMKLMDKITVTKQVKINKVNVVTEKDWKDLFLYVFENRETYKRYIVRIFDSDRKAYPSCVDGLYLLLSQSLDATYTRLIMQEILKNIKIPSDLLEIPYSDFLKIKSGCYHQDFPFKKKNVIGHGAQLIINQLELMNIHNKYSDSVDSVREVFKAAAWNGDAVRMMFNDKFKSDFTKASKDLEKRLDEEVKRIDEENKRMAELKRRNEEMCIRISGPIANFFSNIFKFIYAGIILIFVTIIWKTLIVKPRKGICTVAQHTKIFFVHLWVVSKALKQGACPYMYFEKPVVKEEKIEGDINDTNNRINSKSIKND